MPGVADVTPFGGLIKQYQIQIDPLLLTKYNLSIAQIAQAVRANNQNAGGALLDNKQQSMVIRGVGLIQTIADIENIVVNEDQGRAGLRARHRHGEHRRRAADRHLRRRTTRRRRRRHRADAPRRESHEVLKGINEAVEDINATRLPHGRDASRRSTIARTWWTTRCTRCRTRCSKVWSSS